MFVTASDDGTLRLWDLAGKVRIKAFFRSCRLWSIQSCFCLHETDDLGLIHWLGQIPTKATGAALQQHFYGSSIDNRALKSVQAQFLRRAA